MDDTRPVTDLVPAAAAGDRSAWDTLAERYSSLVLGVARGYRLDEADVADVFQTVWLRLVENLGALREPRALPGWLVTTTRNECLRSIRLQRRTVALEPDSAEVYAGQEPSVPLEDLLLQEERREAVRSALASLPGHCRQLLALLLSDPPSSYEEISRRLDMPHGSIGPTRMRCLGKLRRCPAVAALLSEPGGRTGGRGSDPIAMGA